MLFNLFCGGRAYLPSALFSHNKNITVSIKLIYIPGTKDIRPRLDSQGNPIYKVETITIPLS